MEREFTSVKYHHYLQGPYTFPLLDYCPHAEHELKFRTLRLPFRIHYIYLQLEVKTLRDV
jgi:hypothetical protein